MLHFATLRDMFSRYTEGNASFLHFTAFILRLVLEYYQANSKDQSFSPEATSETEGAALCT